MCISMYLKHFQNNYTCYNSAVSCIWTKSIILSNAPKLKGHVKILHSILDFSNILNFFMYVNMIIICDISICPGRLSSSYFQSFKNGFLLFL